MKRLIILFTVFFLAGLHLDAQTPQAFNYQTVIRNSNGEITPGQNVAFRFHIMKGPMANQTVYTETHAAQTNAYGLVALKIGDGTPVGGSFTGINWSNDIYTLRIELDPAGGSNFTHMGWADLVSVPYAMHAKTAESLAQKSISLNIYGAYLHENKATFGNGFGVNAGIIMSDVSSPAANLNFTLPRDYKAGDEIKIRFLVSANATGNVNFNPNFISIARAGFGFLQGSGATTGFTIQGPVNVTEINKPIEVWGTLVSPVAGNPLKPGDGISFSVYRQTSDANTGIFKIHAVEIHY